MSKLLEETVHAIVLAYGIGVLVHILLIQPQLGWDTSPAPLFSQLLLMSGAFLSVALSRVSIRAAELKAERDKLAESVRRLVPSTVIAQHIQVMASLGLPEEKNSLQPSDVQLFVGSNASRKRITLLRVSIHDVRWLSNGNLLLDTGEGEVVYAPSRYVTLRGERLALCNPDDFTPQGDTDEIILERK